jgi:hypothetical protein
MQTMLLMANETWLANFWVIHSLKARCFVYWASATIQKNYLLVAIWPARCSASDISASDTNSHWGLRQ